MGTVAVVKRSVSYSLDPEQIPQSFETMDRPGENGQWTIHHYGSWLIGNQNYNH